MKKMLALILALILVFSLSACGAKREAVLPDPDAPDTAETPAASGSDLPELPASNGDLPAAGVANPVVQYETLEEINAITGGRLCTPAVMGTSDCSYCTINHGDSLLAQECFTVNGTEYTFRFSPVMDEDISGIYTGEATAFAGLVPSDELQYAEGKGFKAARWFTIDGQYVLSVNDGGSMEKDTFLAIAEELRERTLPGMSEGERTAAYADLAGFYTDAASGRATAEVTANGSEGVTVTVHWSSSAFEYTQWVMEAAFTEDGLLSYPEEQHSVITTNADGEPSEIVLDPAGSGWFDVVDGKLLWSGADDENCRNCVFEKAELSPTPAANG